MFSEIRTSLRIGAGTALAYNVYNGMPRFRKSALERSAAGDLWKHTLSQIPTAYGRLSYLASLRDINSGIYRHHGLAAMFGREESSKALRESHEESFREWLNLPLRDKKHDLMQYFAGLDDPMNIVVEHLADSGIYRHQIPARARKMEQRLFTTDLEALLETIRNGMDGANPGPAASRQK